MIHRLLLAENYLIIALFLFFPTVAQGSFGVSVEEMYRQMLSDENAGQVPAYMGEDFGNPIKKVSLSSGGNALNITRETDENTAMLKAIKAKEKRWQEIILAVKNKNPTPFDIAEIESLSAEGKAEATELLAWMSATGIGVKKDLPKAWLLYTEAARLGVVGASANAEAIYKALRQKKKKN